MCRRQTPGSSFSPPFSLPRLWAGGGLVSCLRTIETNNGFHILALLHLFLLSYLCLVSHPMSWLLTVEAGHLHLQRVALPIGLTLECRLQAAIRGYPLLKSLCQLFSCCWCSCDEELPRLPLSCFLSSFVMPSRNVMAPSPATGRHCEVFLQGWIPSVSVLVHPRRGLLLSCG